jgi:hypothetical protein
MMFIKDGHPVALEDILGWMILSGEDIVDIRCFLVRLVTGDNWQHDHGDDSHKKTTGDYWQIDNGDNSHKRMTRDYWQSNHGDDSPCRETGLCCNRCRLRLGLKANLLFYEVVQGGRHEKRLLLQEHIMRNKQDRTKESSNGLELISGAATRQRMSRSSNTRKLQGNKCNRNWQGSRQNDVEAVNQVFGANEVEIKQKSLEALRLLRQANHALDKICKYLAD